MESMTSPTKRHQSHSNWIRVFVNRVHERTGVWPLVYVSAAFIPQIPADVRANCGLWVGVFCFNFS